MTVDLIIKLQSIGSKQIYLDVHHPVVMFVCFFRLNEGKHSQKFHICDLTSHKRRYQICCCQRLQKDQSEVGFFGGFFST